MRSENTVARISAEIIRCLNVVEFPSPSGPISQSEIASLIQSRRDRVGVDVGDEAVLVTALDQRVEIDRAHTGSRLMTRPAMRPKSTGMPRSSAE